jgi:hypothetical protein
VFNAIANDHSRPRRHSKRLLRGLFYTLTFISARARADEPLFGYVYTTDLLPRDKYEVAQWATWRAGKPVGESDALEGRTELEYGLSDRLQVSAYVNYEWARAYHDNVINGTTLAPTPLATQYVAPDERFNTTRFTGVSLEAIFRILSPYTDPIGLAVYCRPTVGPSFREIESRLIVQRNFRDDRLVLALNIGVIDDRENIAEEINEHSWHDTSSLNLGLAGSYRFATSLSAGLELQNERAFSAFSPFGSGARTNVAYYLGPSIHYANEHLFATITYLSQLPLASDYAHTNADFVVDGRNYSGNAERYRVRVKFGWFF